MVTAATQGETLSRGQGTGPWSAFAAVAGLLLLALLLLFPTILSFATIWSDTEAKTYTHGPLIAAICIWLLARRRRELAAAEVAPSYRMLLLVAALSCAWVVAYRAGIQLLHQLIVPVALGACVWAAFGRGTARQAAIPLAYLLFALPFWSVINGVLQALTVAANRILLRAFAIPAHVEGNLVHIPSGTFEIAGGCSGLHLLIVAAAIAVLYGELNRDTLRVRAGLVALAVAIAIVVNWVRVFTIIVAGHLTDMQHYLVKVDHYYYGWALFGVGMAVFFFFARRIPAAQGTRPSEHRTSWRPASLLRSAAGTLAALAIGPVLLMAAGRNVADAQSSLALPPELAGWIVAGTAGGWSPRYPAADVAQSAAYVRATERVAVFSASYFSQSQGKELIGYDNSLTNPTDDWIARRRVQRGDLEINEIEVVGRGGQRALIWYFYVIGERRFVSELSAQLYYGAASLFRPLLSQVVGLRTECGSSCESARESLDSMVDQLAVEISSRSS